MHNLIAVRPSGSTLGPFMACCLSLTSAFCASAQDNKHPPASPIDHSVAKQPLTQPAPPRTLPPKSAPTTPSPVPQPAAGGQTPIVIPGYGAVAWAANLAGPPTIVTTRAGVSATWTILRPDGPRVTFTLGSGDGRSFPPPVEYDQRLMLRYAAFDPVTETPAVPAPLASAADTNIYLVQFTGTIVPGMLQDLAGAGGVARAFMPNFAYIATIPPEAVGAVRALACVRAVVPYHPAYRLDDAVRIRVWDSRKNSEPADAPSLYNLQTLVPGPELKNDVIAAVLAAGGTVQDVTFEGSLVRALLTPDQVLRVVRSDAILFIDDAGFPEQDMDIIRTLVGADFIEDTLGYTGQGVHAMVVDDYIRTTHLAFQPPVTLLTPASAYYDANHGTSCFGIMFGNGIGLPQGRGLMPNAAQGYFADYDFMTDRVQLDLTASNEVNRCVVQSNSWGHPWVFTYTTDSYEADLAAYRSGMLIVQSQSNSGMQWSRPEAWAKNVFSVGGIEHWNNLDPSDDCHCGLASTGPAADGRVKPDMALHNDQITTTTGWGDLAYTSTFGGTSACAPGVAGCAGLVYQMWHEGAFSGFGAGDDVYASRPAFSTVRALLINSAFRYDFFAAGDAITRFKQGWGVPRLERLYKLRDGMTIVDQSIPLQVGQRADFPFVVAPGAAELLVTMAYRDPPGTTSSLIHRINDLTLAATSPSGVTYWGNAGLLDGNISTPGGQPDTRNVIENVFTVNPEPGAWMVSVYASEVNQDVRPESPEFDADFSLVISSRVAHQCDADWNHDSTVNSTDVSDFISDWFVDQAEGTVRTDIDHNGVTNSTDVSVFINTYFDNIAGGCG